MNEINISLFTCQHIKSTAAFTLCSLIAKLEVELLKQATYLWSKT